MQKTCCFVRKKEFFLFGVVVFASKVRHLCLVLKKKNEGVVCS